MRHSTLSATPRCIYCLEEKAKTEFDQDHVLSRGHGRFRDNLTLLHSVCRSCNGQFGNSIERIDTERSIEAVLRLLYEVRPISNRAAKLKSPPILLPMTAEGPWKGALLEVYEENSHPRMRPVPQVCFASRSGSGKVFVSEAEWVNSGYAIPSDADPAKGAGLFAPDSAGEQRLLQRLREKGIDPTTYPTCRSVGPPPMAAGLVGFNIQCVLTPEILRCRAKSAFNYFAWNVGPDFACRPSFNAVREYIRSGTRPGYHPIIPSNKPLIIRPNNVSRDPRMHVLAVGWSPDKQDILSDVVMYSEIGYAVVLSLGCSEIWREVRSAHRFRLHGRVTRLFGAASRDEDHWWRGGGMDSAVNRHSTMLQQSTGHPRPNDVSAEETRKPS